MAPYWPNQEPYLNQPAYYPYTQMPGSAPRYEIIKVHGSQGVDMFRMAPNSQTLLLDETAPIVWLVQTDGAGYKTKVPYSITPYQQPQPVDINGLADRIRKLEENYEQLQQSNSHANKPNKQQRQQQQQQPEPLNAANTAG